MSHKEYESPKLHGENCFGCGVSNKFGLRANFSFDEDVAHVSFTYRINKQFEGGRGYSHGGILSTLLDEAQGSVCHYLGYLCMTDCLRLKYHKATPIEEELIIRASVTKVTPKKIYTIGSIESNEKKLYVSSQAVWSILSKKIYERFFFNKEDNSEKEFDLKYISARLQLYRSKAIKNKKLSKFLQI